MFDWFSRKPDRTLTSVTRVNPKYAIERRLGGGGMAEVFVARVKGAEGFTRRVALKRILPRFSQDAEFARLFVSEAQLTSRFQHPNLISVLDFDRDDQGRLFLVMELVDGVDLDDLLDTGPLRFPLIIYLAVEILSGLKYAHDLPFQAEDGVRGIVHRDISPHNVLLSWEGAVKVSDFGIAKRRGAGNATVTGPIKGKAAYMSPEQVNAQPLDGRSDLFAVGVMLWEMLCLRSLFRGSTTQETIGRMLFAPISSPRDVRPEVPEDLSRVALGLLARDRAQRTPSAEAAITELVACADHPRSGRDVLIQALAERFVKRARVRAHGVIPGSSTVTGRLGVRKPAPRDAAATRISTLTEPPDAVLDPVAPPAHRPPRTRARRRGIVLTGVAVAGSLVGRAWARLSAGRRRRRRCRRGGSTSSRDRR